MMKNFVFFVLVISVLVSCGIQKNTVAKPEIFNKSEKADTKAFFSQIQKKSDFNVLKISSKIDIQNGKFIPTINATIYIENQQKVWMNMSALFMNMARGIATPQGLKAYERIDKTYIDSDFSYLNKMLNVNFIDYNVLQNLLVGKIFISINEKDFDFTQNEKGYFLKSKEIQKIVVEGKTSEYLINFQFSPSFDLTQVVLKDPDSTDELSLFYEDWLTTNGQRFPQNVKIIIKGKKIDKILIENTKFEFSKMDTPYSVPNNYKKRDL